MGLLDSAFSFLPRVDGEITVATDIVTDAGTEIIDQTAGQIGQVADQAVDQVCPAPGHIENIISYALAAPEKVINEGFSAMRATFGGAGPFSKLNASALSFKELFSKATLGTLSASSAYKAAATLGGATSSAVSAASIKSAIGANDKATSTSHKVKLVSRQQSDPTSDNVKNEVIFDVMPQISENRTAEYESIAPSQMPGEFHKYKGTKSAAWTVTAIFACSTKEQAHLNYVYLNTLRGWTMPYFGEKQQLNYDGRLGAPPPVLDFSGYRGLVGKVPVVLTTVSWNFPHDCDWIPTGIKDKESGQLIPFPTYMEINISLVESFSAAEFNGFDLAAFRRGNMAGAFTPAIRSADPAPVSAGGGRGFIGERDGEREAYLSRAGGGRGFVNEKSGEREEYLNSASPSSYSNPMGDTLGDTLL